MWLVIKFVVAIVRGGLINEGGVMSSEYGKSILPGKICKKCCSSCHFTSPIDDFPCDVTCMRKFDYYSTDHTWGVATCSKCIAVYGENPTTQSFLLVTPPVRSPRDKFWPGL